MSDKDDGNVFITQNDNLLCLGWLQEALDTTTCTTVAELTTGDSLRMTGNSAEPSALRDYSLSGFAGFIAYDS